MYLVFEKVIIRIEIIVVFRDFMTGWIGTNLVII